LREFFVEKMNIKADGTAKNFQNSGFFSALGEQSVL